MPPFAMKVADLTAQQPTALHFPLVHGTREGMSGQ